jgi:dTDP-4-amino-4,6-dideoxygalactose transaminase
MMEVPFLDLVRQHAAIRNDVLAAWSAILDRAAFIGGTPVVQLEDAFAKACHARHAVAVGSGTDALFLIFKAFDLREGDEVIVPVNTFIATSEAVTAAGGKVVFVDVQPDTYLINPELVERAITPRTKGIVAVHLYGQMADMDALEAIAGRNNLWLVEDAAQSQLAEYKGRRAGSIGRAAAFSFYPGKNLGACGDAGAITTNDDSIAHRVRLLREHGSERKYIHKMEGFNMRCDALQAEALRIKLQHLAAWNEGRRRVAEMYAQRLQGADGVVVPVVAPDRLPVWHLYVVLVPEREYVQQALKERGVHTGLHYPIPLHLQEAYSHFGHEEGSFPVAEHAGRHLLSLPMYPELGEDQIDHVCASLLDAVASVAAAR